MKGAKGIELMWLPKEINKLSFYLTDEKNPNKLIETVSVEEGKLFFNLHGGSYTTLTTVINLIGN